MVEHIPIEPTHSVAGGGFKHRGHVDTLMIGRHMPLCNLCHSNATIWNRTTDSIRARELSIYLAYDRITKYRPLLRPSISSSHESFLYWRSHHVARFVGSNDSWQRSIAENHCGDCHHENNADTF